MIKRLLQWALNALALFVTPEIVTSLHVSDYKSAIIFALLLGLVNTFIRPLLILVTLPITVLTLGIFMLVINGLMFWLVTGLVSGVSVPNFGTAFAAALVYSLFTWLIELALGSTKRR